MSTADTETNVYAYGDIDRRGNFFGLHFPQFILTVATAFLAIPLLKSASVWGALFWLAVMGVLLLAAFGRVMDRTIWEWVPIASNRMVQRATAEDRFVGGPRPDFPLTNPVLNGAAGRLRWLTLPTADGSAIGVVHDPKLKTYACTLRVRSSSYSLLESSEQEAKVTSWGLLLATQTQWSSLLERLVWTERTTPDSGDTLQRHFEAHSQDLVPVAVQAYQELIDDAAPTAQRHEVLLTIVMSARRARKAIRRAGNGDAAALAVLFAEARRFEEQVQRAGIEPDSWLSPRELAAVVRTQYDPMSTEMISQRGRGERALMINGEPMPMPAGVDPVVAGPVSGKVTDDHYATDAAFHRIMWASGLPRLGMPAAFVSPLILRSTHRRTMTLVMEPIKNRKAENQLNREQMRQSGDDAFRDKLGKRTTQRDDRDKAETERKMDELLAGHGLLHFSLFVAVSTDSMDELEEATGELETLANMSRIEIRTLYGQQSAAFAAACLPLGLPAHSRGMVTK